ncbi:MAG: biotin synthase BioB [Candidatus Omnitrophota bacterium]
MCFIEKLRDKVLSGEDISFGEAEELLNTSEREFYSLLSTANSIRGKYRSNIVNLCSITNAKSGNCPEDCAFCSQSSYHNADVPEYPLLSADEILNRAREAAKVKTNRFCIVISGRGVDELDELDTICDVIRKVRVEFPKLKIDASLGFISKEGIYRLKEAGLTRYNHNLETAKSYFSSVCTTHRYEDRVATIKDLKEAELEVCCGGIFGLGETQNQRLELAFALRELDVDCVPINFLNPIAGTQFENNPPLKPLELLKMIAIYRFILPKKEIRICGGRQVNLRSLQPLIFTAGADAIIIGNYLTTKGSTPEEDLKMIEDMGLKVDGAS